MMHLNLALKVASTSIKELWYINAIRLIVKVKPLVKINSKVHSIFCTSFLKSYWYFEYQTIENYKKTKWSGINMCVRKTEAVSY